MTTSEPAAALEIRGLRKAFPSGPLGRESRPVLQGLDLRVERGQIFGLLGPNGSGKTTTLKVVLGLCRPDAGEVSVLGLPHGDPAWRARIGYLPEQPYLYDHLTAREYLAFVGRLFDLPRGKCQARSTELLQRVGLTRAADQRLRSYSKGMQQRAALAQALLNDPELVFLDEPMSGLDPVGRRLVRDLILDLRQAGKTVLFSTHILSDAENLCDRVALVGGGSVKAAGRLDEILKLETGQLEMLVSAVAEAALTGLPSGAQVVARLGERLRLSLPEADLGQAVLCVERAGGRVLEVHPVRQSLEDFFVHELAAGGDLA